MKNKSNLIFMMTMTLLVIGALAAMVIYNQSQKEEDVKTDDISTETKKVKTSNDYAKIDTEGQPMLGDKDARVTMIEFGDFKCPACKYFSSEIEPELEKKYVENGDLKIYFVHTPFHQQESMLGGLAGESVLEREKDKYWDFHKALFNLQPVNGSEVEWLNTKTLRKAAKTADIKDVDQLISDVKDTKQKDAVAKDIETVQKYQIKETPTIIVDGKIVKDQLKIKNVEKAIDEALKK